MATAETIRIAAQTRQQLASNSLTPAQAKLYSQRIRKEMGREGLRSFAPAEIDVHLDDAVFLIDCAFIERRRIVSEPGSAGCCRRSAHGRARAVGWIGGRVVKILSARATRYEASECARSVPVSNNRIVRGGCTGGPGFSALVGGGWRSSPDYVRISKHSSDVGPR
jgi:hypothetical protein